MNITNDSAKYLDPDPESALIMGIWFTVLCVVGIPLNILVIYSTLTTKELRTVSANSFIINMALGDTLLLFSFMLHLPYALSSSEVICRISGIGLYMFGLVNCFIPSFLAINRYAIIYSEEKTSARLMLKIFSQRGIYFMNILIWIYPLSYNIPFIVFDTLGLGALGICGVFNRTQTNKYFLLYYVGGDVGALFGSYLVLFYFYHQIGAWVKTMSAGMTLTAQTKETLIETRSVMRMTKWITIVPLIATSPAGIIEIALRIDENLLSIRVARSFISLFPLSSVLNPFLTVMFARPYRLALQRLAKKTWLTSILFLWMFERKWIGQIDVLSGASRTNQPPITNPSFHIQPVSSM